MTIMVHQPVKRPRIGDPKTPHITSVENVFDILPSNLLPDACSVDDHTLELVETRLNELLQSVKTTQEMRRRQRTVPSSQAEQEPLEEPPSAARMIDAPFHTNGVTVLPVVLHENYLSSTLISIFKKWYSSLYFMGDNLILP
jgi:hypothetical protein